MRDSHASRVTKNVLVLHPICGGEYTFFFFRDSLFWTDHRSNMWYFETAGTSEGLLLFGSLPRALSDCNAQYYMFLED
jgi:hypothetical protein